MLMKLRISFFTLRRFASAVFVLQRDVKLQLTNFASAVLAGRGYFAKFGKLSRGNLRKIKCGMFRKLPIVAFPHSAAEKFRISADHKTTVRSHCTTDVQLMVTGQFAYETFRLLDTSPTTWTFRLYTTFRRQSHCGQTDGWTELQFPKQRYSRGKNLSEDVINY